MSELEPMTKWTLIYTKPKIKIKEIWTPPDRALVVKYEGLINVSMENYPKEEEKNE